MAQIYYIELARLLRFKDSAYLQGDFKGWKDGLKAIYRRIYFKLNTQERKELQQEFTTIQNLITLIKRGDSVNNGFLLEKINTKLDDMDTRIVELMDKYKMIFPDVEIKDLASFESKMGLL